MTRFMLTAFASLALLSTNAAPLAAAGQCRKANGQFVKCVPAKPIGAKRCRNAQGKFAKCGTPGAKPA